MIDITGSDLNGSDLYVRYVGFQTGYSYSSGGYNFSIKLTPYPANGKSCQIIFGDLGPNTWAYRGAPAFNEKNSYCRELQLTTNSQIGVSNGSNKSTIYRIVASTSPSRIEAHTGLFRSLMKGIFDPYVL